MKMSSPSELMLATVQQGLNAKAAQLALAGPLCLAVGAGAPRAMRVASLGQRSVLVAFLHRTFAAEAVAEFKRIKGEDPTNWVSQSDRTIPTEVDVLRVRHLARFWVSFDADREDITQRLLSMADLLAPFRPTEAVRVFRAEKLKGEDGWKEQYEFASAWSTDMYDAKVFDTDRRLVTAIAQPEDILVSIPMVDMWSQVYGLGIIDAEKADEVVIIPHPSFEADRQEIPDDAALAEIRSDLWQPVVDAWRAEAGEVPPNALAEAAKLVDGLEPHQVPELEEKLKELPKAKEAAYEKTGHGWLLPDGSWRGVEDTRLGEHWEVAHQEFGTVPRPVPKDQEGDIDNAVAQAYREGWIRVTWGGASADKWSNEKLHRLQAYLMRTNGVHGVRFYIIDQKEPSLSVEIAPAADMLTLNKVTDLKRYVTKTAKLLRPKLAVNPIVRAIHAVSKSPKFRAILDEHCDGYGPFEGSCLVVAKALIYAFGGELVRFDLRQEGYESEPNHYGARINGTIYDFSGGYPTPQAWVAATNTREGSNPEATYVFEEGYDEHGWTAENPQAEKMIAQLLMAAAEPRQKHAKLLQPKQAAAAKLPDLQPIMQEFLAALDPEGQCAVPKISYVSNSSNTLGLCHTNSLNLNQDIVTGANSDITLQKGLAVDLNHLRKVVAHEVCHHVAIHAMVVGKPLKEAQEALAGIGDGHGTYWQAEAEKINARYGAGFVTQTSDMNQLEWESRPAYLFILQIPSRPRPAYCWSPTVSSKIILRMDDYVQESFAKAYVVKTTNRFLTQPHAKGPEWSSPVTKQETEALQAAIAGAQGAENLFASFLAGDRKTRKAPSRPWTLIMINPKRGATGEPAVVNAWALGRKLNDQEMEQLKQVREAGIEFRRATMPDGDELRESLPKLNLNDVIYNPGRVSPDVYEVQTYLKWLWNNTVAGRTAKLLQPKVARPIQVPEAMVQEIRSNLLTALSEVARSTSPDQWSRLMSSPRVGVSASVDAFPCIQRTAPEIANKLGQDPLYVILRLRKADPSDTPGHFDASRRQIVVNVFGDTSREEAVSLSLAVKSYVMDNLIHEFAHMYQCAFQGLEAFGAHTPSPTDRDEGKAYGAEMADLFASELEQNPKLTPEAFIHGYDGFSEIAQQLGPKSVRYVLRDLGYIYTKFLGEHPEVADLRRKNVLGADQDVHRAPRMVQVRAKLLQPKWASPVTPEALAWIRQTRSQIRMQEVGREDGSAGQCGFVAEAIESKFGWPRGAGFYLKDGPGTPHDHSDHVWNVLPGGTILDATHDQFGPPDVATFPPGSPEALRYHAFCGNYDCPHCTCPECNPDWAEEAEEHRQKHAKLLRPKRATTTGPRCWIDPQGKVFDTKDTPHGDWALSFLDQREPGEWTGGASDMAQAALLGEGWARAGSMADLSGPIVYGEAERWTTTTFRAFQGIVTANPSWQGKRVELGVYPSQANQFSLDEFLAANKPTDLIRPGRQASTAPTMGFNVNDGDQPWTDMILSGQKTIETRDSPSLSPHVGERVGIIATHPRGVPGLVGTCVLGEPIVYTTNEQFRADNAKHCVPEGPDWDLQPGAVKYGYPITELEPCKPKIVRSQGRVWRKLAAGSGATNAAGAPLHPTPEGIANFWRWFGASKTVDGAGQPMVFHHGTPTGGFDAFDPSALGSNTGSASSKMGFFFTPDLDAAKHYAQMTDPLGTALWQLWDRIKAALAAQGLTGKIYTGYSEGSLFMSGDWRSQLSKQPTADEVKAALLDGMRRRLEDYERLAKQFRDDVARKAKPKKWELAAVEKATKSMADAGKTIEVIQQALSGVTEFKPDWGPREIKDVYLRMLNPLVEDHQGRRLGRSFAEVIADAKEGGHDGAVILNTEDPNPMDVYIVFEPTQIKGVENSGSFDQGDARLVASQQLSSEEEVPVRKRAKLLRPKRARGFRIYLDMDGVLAGYLQAAEKAGVPPDEWLNVPGAFRHLEVLPGAKEAVAKLQRMAPGAVYILSKPADDRWEESCQEKREWMAEEFPSVPPGHVQLVKDKGAVGRPQDLLLDDHTWNGADRFPGTLILFAGPQSWEKLFAAVEARLGRLPQAVNE